MNWDGYTVFSVISGAILIIGSLAGQGLSAKDRLYGLMGGGFFAGYGVFVASQHSGTYFFPIWIFVLPVGAIVYVGATIVAGNESPQVQTQTQGARRPVSPQPNRAASKSTPTHSSPYAATGISPPLPPCRVDLKPRD